MPFFGQFWPILKFRAFFSKISCPKFLKSSSAIQIKFRANYEISDNLAALNAFFCVHFHGKTFLKNRTHLDFSSKSIYRGRCRQFHSRRKTFFFSILCTILTTRRKNVKKTVLPDSAIYRQFRDFGG